MSKITLIFDTEVDSKLRINAAIRSDDLAICIWELQNRIGNEWEDCEDDDKMGKLITDVINIIESNIGNIDDYTE